MAYDENKFTLIALIVKMYYIFDDIINIKAELLLVSGYFWQEFYFTNHINAILAFGTLSLDPMSRMHSKSAIGHIMGFSDLIWEQFSRIKTFHFETWEDSGQLTRKIDLIDKNQNINISHILILDPKCKI